MPPGRIAGATAGRPRDRAATGSRLDLQVPSRRPERSWPSRRTCAWLQAGSTGFRSGHTPGSHSTANRPSPSSRAGRRAVCRQPVHRHGQRPGHLPSHAADERFDLGGPDVVPVDREVQPDAPSDGRQRQPGDHAQAVAPVPAVHHRPLAPRAQVRRTSRLERAACSSRRGERRTEFGGVSFRLPHAAAAARSKDWDPFPVPVSSTPLFLPRRESTVPGNGAARRSRHRADPGAHCSQLCPRPRVTCPGVGGGRGEA